MLLVHPVYDSLPLSREEFITYGMYIYKQLIKNEIISLKPTGLFITAPDLSLSFNVVM